MRAILALLAYISPVFAQTAFLAPVKADYVNYGDVVSIEIKLTKTVLDAKIIFGRTMGEASRIVLKNNIQAYGDTLRTVVTMPQFYPADDPADRDYKGWARFWLTDNIGGAVAEVQVQVGEPPTSAVFRVPALGQVHRPIIRAGTARATIMMDIMGRNMPVTPAFFWRLPHVP